MEISSLIQVSHSFVSSRGILLSHKSSLQNGSRPLVFWLKHFNEDHLWNGTEINTFLSRLSQKEKEEKEN